MKNMKFGMKIVSGFSIVVWVLTTIVSYAGYSGLSSVTMIVGKAGDDEPSNTVMAAL